MIVDALLGWIEAAIGFVSGMFPESDVDVFANVRLIADNLGAMNYFLPIVETLVLVVAVFALFPVFLGVTLALWVASQLRGSSSVG